MEHQVAQSLRNVLTGRGFVEDDPRTPFFETLEEVRGIQS